MRKCRASGTMWACMGAMKILFSSLCPAAFPVVERQPGSNFLDNSPDIGQGQVQVTAHDLAWKLQ